MRPYEDVNTIYVDHKLGNNGKLVFTAEEPKVEIPVEKQWQGVNPDGQAPVTITLYKVMESETSATAQVLKTLELSKDNGWTGSFDKLRNPGSDWYYAIGEMVPEGFAAIYSGETVQAKLQNGDSAEYVTVTRVVIEGETAQKVTIKNLPNIELPDTGGSGTIFYTAGGLFLIMAAAILLYMQNTKRRREAM
jgi:LPXTG-motif cell wall-anchored protein